MFEISDVLLDKEEIAMKLNIKIELSDNDTAECELSPEISVSKYFSGVSKSRITAVLRKVVKILMAQGFPCCACPQIQYKLLPLSPDCREAFLVSCNTESNSELRFMLLCPAKTPRNYSVLKSVY